MRIFGVIGLNGSGKDEVVKYLKREYNIPYLSIGDMVREVAQEEGLPATRENLHRVSRERIGRFGPEHFVRLAVQRIEQNGWKSAGITGIRTPEDVRYLKDRSGADFTLLHVHVSDPRIRFERTRNRDTERDPQTYDEFLQQDRNEQNEFDMDRAIQQADYTLNNDESVDRLHDEIDRVLLMQESPIDKEGTR